MMVNSARTRVRCHVGRDVWDGIEPTMRKKPLDGKRKAMFPW